jgi:hypothetical protein
MNKRNKLKSIYYFLCKTFSIFTLKWFSELQNVKHTSDSDIVVTSVLTFLRHRITEMVAGK